MSELLAEHKAILDLARDADEPSPDRRERLRLLLASRLGVAAGLAVVATSTPKLAANAASTMGLGGSLAGKLVLVAALIGGGGAVALLAAGRATGGPVVSRMLPAPPMTVASRALSASMPSEGASPGSRAVGSPSIPSSRASEPAPGDTLEAEVRLVQDGDTALRAQDAALALTLFDRHARLFPRGVLAEERSGERILALCALGRTDEARVDAADFLRTYGSSPIAARVRASCAGGGNSSP